MKLTNWFRKKTKTTPEEKDEILNFKKDFSIRIQGYNITPLFNQQVSDLIALEILRLPLQKRVKTKYMSMAHSDICLYVSLREGAKKQNIPFNVNIKELFHLIDYFDYSAIYIAMQNSWGGSISVNSITNN